MLFAILHIVAALVTVFVGIYTYTRWKFFYWRKRGVPYVKPSFPFGNIENPIRAKKPLFLQVANLYGTFKSAGCKHGGFFSFTSPIYIPVDPDHIKNIMTRDFSHFVDRDKRLCNEKRDPMSGHLINLKGNKWKTLRAKLTPTFSSGKIKAMVETMVNCGNQMIVCVDQLSQQKQTIDVKEICCRYTTDIIGSCAFGIECNSFKDGKNEFREQTRNILEPPPVIEQLRSVINVILPSLNPLVGVYVPKKETKEFLLNVVKQTASFREASNLRRNDFMQLLIDLMNDSVQPVDQNLTIEQVAAQAFVFFLAGFETSSTAMTFCLLELAINSEIQNKLRKDIKDTLAAHNNKMTYEAIMQMKYLDQVVDETLRKYPPVANILRVCVRDYKIPDTNITIEERTKVWIPVFGLHHDAEYYPEPEKFDPDRFSQERKRHIRPYTYLPFGEGPRICIGSRFASMQTKVGLATLLERYRFTLNAKTKLPIQFSPQNLGIHVLSAKNGIWLDVERV